MCALDDNSNALSAMILNTISGSSSSSSSNEKRSMEGPHQLFSASPRLATRRNNSSSAAARRLRRMKRQLFLQAVGEDYMLAHGGAADVESSPSAPPMRTVSYHNTPYGKTLSFQSVHSESSSAYDDGEDEEEKRL